MKHSMPTKALHTTIPLFHFVISMSSLRSPSTPVSLHHVLLGLPVAVRPSVTLFSMKIAMSCRSGKVGRSDTGDGNKTKESHSIARIAIKMGEWERLPTIVFIIRRGGFVLNKRCRDLFIEHGCQNTAWW
ncbi:hypothetical protein ElyMa_001425600 [Elysia marginata]|uniref:Uncharacterized protein n=1 Tax=Elysia marginata TaxID=1093978 RepID=A0AAV4IVB3_9GAST|nr:hypothetical protein ElyMa_001425600 [Elysia marginata]